MYSQLCSTVSCAERGYEALFTVQQGGRKLSNYGELTVLLINTNHERLRVACISSQQLQLLH